MRRVINLPVRPELSLDVLVAQKAKFPRQVAPVGAQEAPVERDRRQQRHGLRAQAGSAASRCRRR